MEPQQSLNETGGCECTDEISCADCSREIMKGFYWEYLRYRLPDGSDVRDLKK